MVSDGHLLDRSAAARKRLGITQQDMEGVPRVTDRIVAGAGSTEKAIEALRGDDASDALAFIAKYDSIPVSDRDRLSLEEILVASGLTARRFIEVLTGALMQQASDVTKMLVSVAQPKVTAATVKAATEERPILDREGEIVGYAPGDVKAQEIFHKISGLLPTPKGAQTIINMQQLNQGGKDDDGDEGGEELQPFDDYLLEIQSVIRPQLAAPKAPDAIMPINVPELDLIDAEI